MGYWWIIRSPIVFAYVVSLFLLSGRSVHDEGNCAVSTHTQVLQSAEEKVVVLACFPVSKWHRFYL